MPDLVVSRVFFTPSIATPNDRIMINVEITNQGNATAVIPLGKTVWLATRPNGRGFGPVSNGEAIGPGLSISRGLSLGNAGELTPGTYHIPVTADSGGSVRESRETNNELLCALTIFETNWRPLLQEALALVRELHRYETTKGLAARIEAELKSSEAAMLAAEQFLNRKPVSSQAAQYMAQELGARSKNLERLIGEAYSIDQRANRTVSLLSNVMKAQRDMQMATVQNIR